MNSHKTLNRNLLAIDKSVSRCEIRSYHANTTININKHNFSHSDFQSNCEDLLEDGYLFLPQYFNIESNEVNNIENEVRKNGFVNDYVTTYYPEKLNGILQKLDEDLRLNEIVNHVKKKSSLLSVCRFYISEKLTEIQGSFLWHHDALFDYYKILVYLTEVNEEDGPFEYIPKSNQNEWKYYSFKRSRFSDEILKNEKKIKFIGKPGDVIILNANGIHRACNPSSNHKRIVASKAFIDFISEESTDHTIAKSRILKLPNPYVV